MCESIRIQFRLFMQHSVILVFYLPVGKKLGESFHSLIVRSLNDLLAGNNVIPNPELLSSKHDTKLTSRRLLFPDAPSINVCERFFRLV
jgi:hypothetical protein